MMTLDLMKPHHSFKTLENNSAFSKEMILGSSGNSFAGEFYSYQISRNFRRFDGVASNSYINKTNGTQQIKK